MSFVLPGNARQLRFSGEAKVVESLPDELPPAALGRPRVRKPRSAASTPAPAEVSAASGWRESRAHIGTPSSDQAPAPLPRIPAASLRRKLDEMANRWPGAHAMPRADASVSVGDSDWRAPKSNGFADDDNPTTAMARDPLDDLPPPGAYRAPKPVAVLGGVAPIPYFRAQDAGVQTALIPHGATERTAHPNRPAPLVVWIAASLLAGLVSYYVAPQIMARLDVSTATAAR